MSWMWKAKGLICMLLGHRNVSSRDRMRYICMRCGNREFSSYAMQEFLKDVDLSKQFQRAFVDQIVFEHRYLKE